MKKYLSELSRDELKSLFDNNNLLRRAIWESALEYVDSCNVGEYLYRIDGRAASYDIGYCGQWMSVQNPALFLEWVECANSDFEIFYSIEKDRPGYVNTLCERGREIAYRLDNYELSDKNTEMMENRLDEICDLFRRRFLKLCSAEYDWIDDDENLFYFWMDEINAQCGCWEECYTMGDGKVYRDYTKEIGA